MTTKGKRADAALLAAMDVLNSGEQSLQIAIEAGRLSALAHFAGYLSTKQIEHEIEKTTEILRDTTFAESFKKRLKEAE